MILLTPVLLAVEAALNPEAFERYKHSEIWQDIVGTGICAVILGGIAIYLFYGAYREKGSRAAALQPFGWCVAAVALGMLLLMRGEYSEANGFNDAQWYTNIGFAVMFYGGLFLVSSGMMERVSKGTKAESLVFLTICVGCVLLSQLFMYGAGVASELAWMVSGTVFLLGIGDGIIYFVPQPHSDLCGASVHKS